MAIITSVRRPSGRPRKQALTWSRWYTIDQFLREPAFAGSINGSHGLFRLEFPDGDIRVGSNTTGQFAATVARTFRDRCGRSTQREGVRISWALLSPEKVREALIRARRDVLLARTPLNVWSPWLALEPRPETRNFPRWIVGVYAIREADTGVVRYIGRSAHCIRGRLLQHFQPYRAGGIYCDVVYESRAAFQVAWRRTTWEAVYRTERQWIERWKPTDNTLLSTRQEPLFEPDEAPF